MASINSQLLVNEEGTPGTYSAPEAADVIDFISCDFGYQGNGPQRRDMQHSTMTGITPSVPGARWWSGTIKTEVKAATDAGEKPEISALLLGAGFEETVDAGTSVTYDLFDDPCTSTNRTSLSIKLEEFTDGNQWIAHGARNNMVLNFGHDAPLTADWAFVGGYTQPADTSITASPSYNTGTPLVKLSDTNPILIGAYEPVLLNGSVNLNWTPQSRPNMAGTSTDGYLALPVWLSRGDNIALELTIEEEDETAYGAWAAMNAGTAVTTVIIFEAGDRALSVTLSNCVIIGISKQAAAPNTYTLNYSCTGCELVFA